MMALSVRSCSVTIGRPDTTAPLVRQFVLKRKRRSLSFVLNEASLVAVVFKRRGQKKITRVMSGAAARNRLKLPRKVRRGKGYRITIIAIDGAGNASPAAVLKRRA